MSKKLKAVIPPPVAIETIADPAQRQLAFQNAADMALARGPAGKTSLPDELHAAFGLTLQAFAHYEAGCDEEARTALQGIGLQSPFLEWKLLLRGLIAYQANDDARALENWQRLDQARLPSRLCAAMRAGIDSTYLVSQTPAIQQKLRVKGMQLRGLSIAPAMSDIKEILHGDRLTQAFRKAEPVVAVLKRDHADLAARFAQCFFWAVIEHGDVEDLERYRRVFGVPAADPKLYRLEALALEARGMWPEAHKVWQNFIGEVAQNSAAWPGESGQRVQALIWNRMAQNAAFKRKPPVRSENPFFDLFAARTAPLKPSAEKCLENAIKLAPDRLETYRALFNLYYDDDKYAKAKKVGQQLLKRFPDHVETLDALGDLCMLRKDYKQAQEYFEQAMHANPLDRSLRLDLARAKQNYALTLTLADKHDKAREQYEQALPLKDGSKTSLLCQWAVAEMKANNLPRAEELIAQAQSEPDHRLACRFTLVGESVRANLPTKEKKQIAQELKAALAQTPTPAEVLVLIESAASQRHTHDETFHGQQAQEKKILKFVDGIKFNEFNEAQLVRLCRGLAILLARKPWLKCLNHARRHFLKNPFFRLSFTDYYLLDETGEPKPHLAREHLDAARRLIEEMPRGEQQQQYFEQIKTREELIAEITARVASMMGGLGAFMDGFGGFEDDDDFDDYDESDGW